MRQRTRSPRACVMLLFLGATAAPVLSDDTGALPPDSAFQSIRTYDHGESRMDLVKIEEAARGASPKTLAAMEVKLLAALSAPETRQAGKQFVVRWLRRFGSDRCVPVLSRMVSDPELSHLARFALERLPAPGATLALREALSTTDGELRVGVVGSLAGRGDRSAVPDLASLLAAGDQHLARATLRALGQLGGAAAADTLISEKVSPQLEEIRLEAVITCAEGLLREGKTIRAVVLCRSVAADPEATPVIRLAAQRGLLLAGQERAVPGVVALLESSEVVLRQGAIRLLRQASGPAITRAMATSLESAGPRAREVLIEILADRGDPAAYESVVAAVGSQEARVRLAALRALGSLGGAPAVAVLVPRLIPEGEEGTAAFESLKALRGEGVLEAILARVGEGPPARRIRVIQALVARRETDSVAALMAAARAGEAPVRNAAIDALGLLAGPGDVESLATMLLGSEDDDEGVRIAAALAAAAERLADRENTTRSLLAALEGADDEDRSRLLGVLPVLSTSAALAAVRGAVDDESDEVSAAALRALANWRTPAPLDDLVRLVRNASDPDRRSTALGGFTRLLGLPSNRPALETVRWLEEALKWSDDAGERKRILAAVADFPCKEGLALAESFASDAVLGETARETAAAVRGTLIANSLAATASHNPGETRNAFDGDQGTRWTTGTPMRPGMWFTIDLGAEQSVRRIVLDSRNSPGDYPRGCRVYVSFDGKTWGEPVLESPPQRPVTRLVFSEPVRGRFVKIEQTGETQGLFWSIHELNIAFE